MASFTPSMRSFCPRTGTCWRLPPDDCLPPRTLVHWRAPPPGPSFPNLDLGALDGRCWNVAGSRPTACCRASRGRLRFKDSRYTEEDSVESESPVAHPPMGGQLS